METTAALSELERVQTRILQRISDLELRADLSGTTTEGRLSSMLLENGVKDFEFKRVSFDYYDWSLETRRDVVGAASIHHLCKSIVLVSPLYSNTWFFRSDIFRDPEKTILSKSITSDIFGTVEKISI